MSSLRQSSNDDLLEDFGEESTGVDLSKLSHLSEEQPMDINALGTGASPRIITSHHSI